MASFQKYLSYTVNPTNRYTIIMYGVIFKSVNNNLSSLLFFFHLHLNKANTKTRAGIYFLLRKKEIRSCPRKNVFGCVKAQRNWSSCGSHSQMHHECYLQNMLQINFAISFCYILGESFISALGTDLNTKDWIMQLQFMSEHLCHEKSWCLQ